jgi:hypothetical protein
MSRLEGVGKSGTASSGLLGQLRVRIGALVALAIAAGFIIWAAVGGGGGGGSSPTPAPITPNVPGTPPVALSYGGLKTFTATLHQPIYWLGTKPNTMYELRQLQNAYVYLRYLPSGLQAGEPRALLTVGTYPMQNAYSTTQSLTKGSGVVPLNPGHGGVALYNRANPTDAYVAFPGSDYQIEVYSPVPGVARRLVTRGVVRAVPGGAAITPGVRAVSRAALRRLAKSLGQPIYWLGPQPSVTYELTQTSSGRLYVRYLPKGVKVGAPGTYLTIGTYPLANAYTVTQALGRGSGNDSLDLAGGGIAVFGKAATAKNVYVAYRGSDYQVEVFAPVEGNARKLVKAGRIVALH